MLAFIFFAILQLVLALPAPLSQRDLAATGPRAPIGAPLSSSTIPVVVRSRSEEDVLLPREEASLYTTIPLEKRSTLETIESRDYCTGEACESPAWTAYVPTCLFY